MNLKTLSRKYPALKWIALALWAFLFYHWTAYAVHRGRVMQKTEDMKVCGDLLANESTRIMAGLGLDQEYALSGFEGEGLASE